MKLNISYSPDEEDRVKRIAQIVAALFPKAHFSIVQKSKYKHCYVDTRNRSPCNGQKRL